MKQSIIMRYQTTYEQAFDAVLKSLQNCRYRITDVFRGRGEIQFQPRFAPLLPTGRLDLSIHFFDWEDGRIDLDFIYESPLKINMESIGGKYAGRVFLEIDKILGNGKLIQGTLVQPGFRNEMKRLLLVLAMFAFTVTILTLILIFWK